MCWFQYCSVYLLCDQSYSTVLQCVVTHTYIAHPILLTRENICDIGYCIPQYCDVGNILLALATHMTKEFRILVL